MQVRPCSAYSLYAYSVESGLWAHTMLGSEVSPPSVEAMNAILRKDGILAYIGGRSGFWDYVSELKDTNGTAYRHSWTGLPAHTILAMLGLCQNMPTAGRSRLTFYGSPLTITVTLLMAAQRKGVLDKLLDRIESSIRNAGLFSIEPSILEEFSLTSERFISGVDLEEALTYLDGRPDEGNATGGFAVFTQNVNDVVVDYGEI